MLLLQDVDFIFFLLISDFALGHFLDQLFIFSIEGGNALDFVGVLPFQDSLPYLIFVVLVSFDHQCFQQNVDLVYIIQFREILFELEVCGLVVLG